MSGAPNPDLQSLAVACDGTVALTVASVSNSLQQCNEPRD